MISRKGFTLMADAKTAPEKAIPRFGDAHPVGGPSGAAQADRDVPGQVLIEDRTGDEFDQFRRHARDFLDCVRSRKETIAGPEEGHRVATACHLANLSLRLGRMIRWDPHRESVLHDSEAEAMLERPYRAPWDAELRSLLRTSPS